MKPLTWYYKQLGKEVGEEDYCSPGGIECATFEAGKESAPSSTQRRATSPVIFRKSTDTKTGLAQIKDVLTQCRDALKIKEDKPGK